MSQLIKVKVTPRAGKNEILSFIGDVLSVKIKAEPKNGKANKELLCFLSKEFGARDGEIKILKGHTSRNKELSFPDNVLSLQNKLI